MSTPNTKVIAGELAIDTRINKKGEEYKMLMVFVKTKTGEKIFVHEIYLQESFQYDSDTGYQ